MTAKEDGVGTVRPLQRGGWQQFWQQIALPEDHLPSLGASPKKRVLVLSGPTAVGKTALSLQIAKAIGGEIISADSMQVYKGMDIGTAKPSIVEQQEVPHHLLDIRNVRESFNVVDFWKEASEAVEEVFARGHIPILVGGTGFYLHAFLYGPPGGPPSDAGLRRQLEETLEQQGSAFLFAELSRLDPEYARSVSLRDTHKVIRALEIIALSGKKVSSFAKQTNRQPYEARCWFLYRPKEILYERIHERCDEMIRQGFLYEVEALHKEGLADNPCTSMAIGYRQALEFLSSPRSHEDMEHFVYCFKQASRRYAKRQFTWFRKEPLFRWLDLEETQMERALEIILQDFEKPL
ncbi:MAG: tRNA (adenosine(37)-N6)-dimethylallyltransferase MiaA [Chlamydiae bacterium]|nr:tRNA (adenosine(37)-N6)-dimethylallyltransferase MiaA [Chlamydiota bacterium]